MIHLKEANRTQIKAFFKTKCRNNDIQGTKLEALYNLIQKKGVIISSIDKHEKFKGCKALNIGEGLYITLKHTPYKEGSFYPCKLDQMYMQEL